VPAIDDRVRRFIASEIHSVEQLEVLLLLQGSPEREWRASEVSQQLASHPHSAETRLLDLRARGLVQAREQDGELIYRYAPPRETEPIVAALATAYAERRTSVITMIFSKPIDSVRTLADAFLVRNGKRRDEEA
jgi:hypothetical protein